MAHRPGSFNFRQLTVSSHDNTDDDSNGGDNDMISPIKTFAVHPTARHRSLDSLIPTGKNVNPHFPNKSTSMLHQYKPHPEIKEEEDDGAFGRAAESTQMETDDEIDPQRMDHDVDMTWSKLLEDQCPYLYALIRKEDGDIDPAALDDVMRRLQLNPCNPNTADHAECLQRNCSILWRFYIQRKNKKNDKWKRCGNSLTDEKHYSSDCVQAQMIADHMFSERDSFSYRPGDIAFLYDLATLEGADKSKFGTIHKITKKRGDVILKVNYKVNSGAIHGNNIMRYILLNNPDLLDHFINIYNLEVGTDAIQPNRKKTNTTNMYLLLESMDGSLTNFKQYFESRDPQYWNRLNRMLCHCLFGLYRLNRLGYAHNDIKKENTLYKLDWERNLVAIKFGDYDCVGPLGKKPLCVTDRSFDPLTSSNFPVDNDNMRYEAVDRFAFGVMVYELLFGEHFAGKNVDKTWSGLYTQSENPSSQKIHENIQKLLSPNYLQPVATVAYYFLVNDRIFHNQPRWTYEMAFEFLKASDLSRDILPPLPTPGEIPNLPHPYMNW